MVKTYVIKYVQYEIEEPTYVETATQTMTGAETNIATISFDEQMQLEKAKKYERRFKRTWQTM